MIDKPELSDERFEALLRLECLKLARLEGVMNPDVGFIISRAEKMMEFVRNPSEDDNPMPKRRGRPPKEAME
jgi:hypothetical protein